MIRSYHIDHIGRYEESLCKDASELHNKLYIRKENERWFLMRQLELLSLSSYSLVVTTRRGLNLQLFFVVSIQLGHKYEVWSKKIFLK